MHAVHIEDVRNMCKSLENLKGRYCWDVLNVEWKIMLKLLITIRMGRSGLDLCGVSIRTNGTFF